MKDAEYKKIVAMLTVIYKKVDIIERKTMGKGSLSTSDKHYVDELESEADKIISQILL